MNRKPLPVGVDDFGHLVTRDYYFVDKSLLVKDLLEQKGVVNLFTRPRRFGKTLNMSMLRYFFEDARNRDGEKEDVSYLFENLKIMDSGEQYLQHMGKYPIISLTLKSAKQRRFNSSYRMLVSEIAAEYERHQFILADSRLESKKVGYLALMNQSADMDSYKKSLKFLSECLNIYYGRKVIILIDEYDVPLESAYFSGYYDEMVDFIRSLFESALKTNPYLEFSVITGCLRISKESIFTGMNNLKIISILNRNYDEYFGFTEQEVRQLCEDYGMPQKYEAVKEWYNGYVFGNANVYNPWSVILYLSDLLADINVFPSPYWANTSSNSIVRTLIEHADEDTKSEIEGLIEGGTVEKPVHEDITYDEVNKTKDNLWNFMFFTGYFRKVGERMEMGQRYVTITIPNEEVRYIFRNKVLGWFDEQVKAKDRTNLFRALIEMDSKAMQEEIEEMLLATISFNDAYESFYHGFLAGILGGMANYIVKSNREGGTGRTDLFIKPVSRRRTAYVMEFKVAKKYAELEKRAEDALKQIADRNYGRELMDDGYSSIVYYGIAFFGKNCEVRVQGNVAE